MAIPEWQQAVQEEMDALLQNGTWSIVDLPKGKKPDGCKWVFTPKYRVNGILEK